MKKLLALSIGLTLLVPSAHAAPKAITAQVGSIYSAPLGTEGIIQIARNSIYFQNTFNKTSDIVITARDLTNTQTWQTTIDSGLDEVATSATFDAQGNLWLSGAASLASAPESYTPINGIDNPDMVIVDSPNSLRSDLSQIALWKIAPTGELLATYLSVQASTPLITAISISSSGISLIGALDGKQFLLSSSLTGVFGKVFYIGTSKTELTSVVRNSDGSSYIFGTSAETLAGKKVAGVRDGILAKVSKTGAITSLVRSSAIKALRSWNSADASLFLTGPVVTGKTIESAITKFTPTFSPTWTTRIPSTGDSIGVSGGGNYYVALTSKSTIPGISNWKPTSSSLIVLTFDSKGVIKAAHSFPGLVNPLSLQFTRERGVVGAATGSDGLVSIFTLASR